MYAVNIENLTYQYGKDEQVLHDISLSIPMGSRVAILGPNGAGKSTLLHHLNGLKTSKTGCIQIMGIPLNKKTVQAIRQKVGLVFQDPDDQVFSSTVWEDVQFGPRHIGCPESEIEERCRASLGSVGMLEHRSRAPYHLSFGQKKRVAIAGILAMKPDIVVLDEPMSYLDPLGQDEVSSLLRGLNILGKTIIVTTHDVDFAASWADMVILMKEGRVLTSGGPDLLLQKRWIEEAHLHLPRIARLFLQLPEFQEDQLPKNEIEAVRMLSRILYQSQY